MSVSTSSPPEAKKPRVSAEFPTQVVVPSSIVCDNSPEIASESPAGPSSARSSNGSAIGNEEDSVMQTGNLIEFISKNILGNVFKIDEMGMIVEQKPRCPSTPSTPSHSTIPGAVAVSQMPTAQLFAEDDWSWHRNPAASIRSGGTNKQTPVWKYFVYDKTDNLSRCIVGDCTYQLKGPHTSTLACHLKKHPAQYAEFQALKNDYSRDRTGGHFPPSPSSSSSSSSTKLHGHPLSVHLNNNNNNNIHVTPVKEENKELITPVASRTSNSTPPTSMNPFPFLFHTTPNTSYANSLLQQHGMAIGPHGQLMMTKKWRRDERKQRELEQRLCLFMSSARLPSSFVFDPTFRDLLEHAQPKFNCPSDATQMEQMLTSQFTRLQMALRQQVHSSKGLSLLVDVVSPSSSSSRLAITAALLTPNHSLDLLLLAVRAVDKANKETIQAVLQQITSEYSIHADKITRIIISGAEIECDEILGIKKMDAYKPRLLSAFVSVIDRNEKVALLKKRFYAMVVSFVTTEGLFQSLTKAIGHTINLPLTESFFSLLEAVLAVKDELIAVLTGASIEGLSNDEWRLCECLMNLFNRLSTKGGETIETIDTVVPSLMQMLVSVDKDSSLLGDLGEMLSTELRKSSSHILESTPSSTESDYLLATSLNPQLLPLLDDDQVQQAKQLLERAIQERLRANEESSNKKRAYHSLDQLLATVVDRRNGTEGDSTSLLYPDLMQAAQLKKKQPESREKSRFAEALVQSYFEEAVQTELFSPSASFANRHLPAPAFWHSNMHTCPQLAQLALQLLSIPATTPGAEGIFGVKGSSFDPLSLLLLPDRLEKDALLRFNRHLLPRSS